MSKEVVKELIKKIKAGEIKVEDLTREKLIELGVPTCSNGEFRRLSHIFKEVNE